MQPIVRPDWIDGAKESISQTLLLDSNGIFPEEVRGFILATPAKRLLRAVYGSSYAAIWAWLKSEIRTDCSIRWWRLRTKLGLVWMDVEDREMYDLLTKDEDLK